MKKFENSLIALSLLSLCACSNKPTVISAPPLVYQGVPAGLLARCTVNAVQEAVMGDIVTNRIRYKTAFEKCAAQVDAIRKWDADARQ